ncbi:transglutaminase family protein [Thalassobius sp. S69A]|uniref:transglutaminase family protein n=1 Tax=unclassified Thalassovita TaxID=2619711 RepID=UPI000C0FE710|nr:transglutaminase [Paracoccaceae bacterium]MBT25788.1 transglutaminase [Paracoccaceae bacterium]
MLYDLTLTLENTYRGNTDTARNVIRMLPLTLPNHQELIAGRIDINPAPDERRERNDFFGNAVTEVAFRKPLRTLTVTLRARVARRPQPTGMDLSPSLPGLLAELRACSDLTPNSPLHYLTASPRITLDDAFAAYARTCVQPGMTVLQIMLAIGKRLHRDMRFDAKATDVDTPPLTAFQNRHGVCQDFSHVMIACLRSLGIPAGYVSGFLRTTPPKGQPRLEGADAMHAWVRAWCGNELGWAEFDPTNDLMVGTDHIVVGYGRDYADVAPLKGVLRTSGQQSGTHSVDVIPVPA